MADLLLELRVPGARDGAVRMAWTPPRGPARGWAWLQHGFARRGRHLAGLAGALAERGIAVVRPDLGSWTPWHSLHDPAFLTSAALTIATSVERGIPQDRGIDVAGPWVAMGHSAGAAVACHVSGVLAGRPGGQVDAPAGLVLLDPVDSVGRLLASSLPSIAGLPMTVLACPPSRCNRHGETVDRLRARAEIIALSGLSHADPERIPASLRPADVPTASRAALWACGPAGSPAAVVDLGERAVSAAATLLPP